jgi:hypothetical protein
MSNITIDLTADYRKGEHVIVKDNINHWPSNHGVIVQCAYFPPASPGSITITRYRVEIIKSGGNYTWVDDSQIETDREYYRDEKIKELGI